MRTPRFSSPARALRRHGAAEPAEVVGAVGLDVGPGQDDALPAGADVGHDGGVAEAFGDAEVGIEGLRRPVSGRAAAAVGTALHVRRGGRGRRRRVERRLGDGTACGGASVGAGAGWRLARPAAQIEQARRRGTRMSVGVGSGHPWRAAKSIVSGMARVDYPDLASADAEALAMAERIKDQRGGRLLNLFKMQLHNPAIAGAWLDLGSAVRFKASSTPRPVSWRSVWSRA